MKKLEAITAKKFVSYEEATLRLRPGITVIHGSNLDRPESKSSNGAGKSLIVSLLPDIRYGSPPLPMKAKKSWKETFKKGTEQGIVIIDEHDNKFEITRTSTKLIVKKNGKDEAFRKKSDVEESVLEKLIPQNEEQFFTLNYLDTKRPPVLQYGTDAQRHHFIEKLYKLDIYNQLGEVVKKDWEKTQRLVQEIEVLDRQLSDKSRDIKGDPKDLKEKQEKLLRKSEKIRKRVSDLLASRQQCRTFITLAEGLDLNSGIEVLESKLKTLRRAKKEKQEARSLALGNNKKHEAFSSLQETRERLEKELEQYSDVVVDKTIQDRIREDTQSLDTLEENIRNNEEASNRIKKLKERVKEAESFDVDLKEKLKKQAEEHGTEKLGKQLTKERVLLKELRANLVDTKEHFEDHDDQNCPICATALDKETMAFIVDKKEKRIKEISAKIEILERMIEYVKNIETIQEYREQIKEEQKNITWKGLFSPDHLRKKIEENEALLGKMRKKVICKGKLKELPEAVDAPLTDLEPLDAELEKLEEKIERVTKTLDAQQSLNKLELPFRRVQEAQDKQETIDESLQQYQPLLDTVQEKLNRVSTDATRAETLSEEVGKLSESIKDLTLKTADHKIKAALRKAFGPRGIRKQRVAEIGAALETAFNDYAHQIFDFPIKFEIIITDTKFQILAHRNGGVSDVRKLSGAESRYFSLLTMLTLIQFAPSDMRLDTVILDEMESNLDSVFRKRYVEIFLPLLLTLCPKIIVVTPLLEKELFIPKSYVYVVEKKNNVSRLKKIRG